MPPVVLADLTALTNSLQTVLGQVKTMMQTVAPLIVGIAVLMLGVMYTGAGIPGLKTWKEENPKAASSIMIGIVILFVASSLTTGWSFS